MGRKIIIFSTLVIAMLLAFSSCDKKLIRIQKDINTKPITFDLPAIPASGGFDFTQNARLDLKRQLDSLNIKIFEITEITVKEVTIDIADQSATAPQRVTFDVLDDIHLNISAPEQATQLIAWKNPVPHEGLQQLKMDVNNNLNLLPYALSDVVTYRVYGTSNKPTTAPIKMTVNIKWHVVVEGPF